MPNTTLSRTGHAAAIGAFLKSTRSSRTSQAPPPTVSRRRVKGLRREEVASAAGISVTWYTWIEQGRPISCSRDTLERIASALRMDAAERKHLFDLAGRSVEPSTDTLSTEAPAELAALVDAMRYNPAYLINALWDVLHFNDACSGVLGPFERGSRLTGNVLRRLFLDETWRRGFQDWEATAQSAVAQFRSATARMQGTDAFASLVTGLADESAEFRTMWDRKRLALPPLKRKTFSHPTAGVLTLHYTTMKPAGVVDDVSIVLYVPVTQSFDAVCQLSLTARHS